MTKKAGPKANPLTFALRYPERWMAKELKTDMQNLRIASGTRMALNGVFELEDRSMANPLKYLVVDYYKRHDVEMPKATKKVGHDACGAKSE